MDSLLQLLCSLPAISWQHHLVEAFTFLRHSEASKGLEGREEQGVPAWKRMATWRGLAVNRSWTKSKQKYVWNLAVNSLFVGFWTSHVRTQYICIHSARYQNWVCPRYPAAISKLVSDSKPVFWYPMNICCPGLLYVHIGFLNQVIPNQKHSLWIWRIGQRGFASLENVDSAVASKHNIPLTWCHMFKRCCFFPSLSLSTH